MALVQSQPEDPVKLESSAAEMKELAVSDAGEGDEMSTETVPKLQKLEKIKFKMQDEEHDENVEKENMADTHSSEPQQMTPQLKNEAENKTPGMNIFAKPFKNFAAGDAVTTNFLTLEEKLSPNPNPIKSAVYDTNLDRLIPELAMRMNQILSATPSTPSTPHNTPTIEQLLKRCETPRSSRPLPPPYETPCSHRDRMECYTPKHERVHLDMKKPSTIKFGPKVPESIILTSPSGETTALLGPPETEDKGKSQELKTPINTDYPYTPRPPIVRYKRQSAEPERKLEPCNEATKDPNMLPTLHVASTGLLTIHLRYDIAVELTLDRAIRVVNNRHHAVVATNNKGTSCCIHHPAAKIYHEGNTTEADLFLDRKAKMANGKMTFACGDSCFQLAQNGMQVALKDFTDMTNDQSITILFSSSSYGPHLVAQYEEMVSNSTYKTHKDGAISVKVNGIKIHQRATGEVSVTAGRKYIRTSPVFGSIDVETHALEMSVEQNWNVKIHRGSYRLTATFEGLSITDNFRECGFDQNQQIFIQPLSGKKPMMSSPMSSEWSGNNNRWSFGSSPSPDNGYTSFQKHHFLSRHYDSGVNISNSRPRTFSQTFGNRTPNIGREMRPRSLTRIHTMSRMNKPNPFPTSIMTTNSCSTPLSSPKVSTE